MIQLKNIHKSFGNHIVLSDASLELRDGEIHSVIGKSGTGKTVLIKSIIGLTEPDAGHIIIDGADVTNYSEREFDFKVRPHISFIFQEGALWDSLTVKQNICLALRLQKHMDEDERQARIADSLKLVDLGNIQDEFPEELSGGMLKRLSIARAIATRPKYLLYDEPTTGLDPVLSNVINNLIKKLNGELGITSLIISHDIAGTERISDRVSMLHDGKIILTCETEDIWRQENEIFNNFIYGEVETNDK